MTLLHIQLTDDELQHLRRLAQDYGFNSPEAYVKSLALEPTREELLDDIRQGILAAKRGDLMSSLDEMWAEVERDDDNSRP